MPVALGVQYGDVRGVFSSDDMPPYVQIEGINRFVPTRTTIAPDGKPRDCAPERSSGDPKLDAFTCAIIWKRGKCEPPKWPDGSLTYAVLRTPVSWLIGGPASKKELQKAYPPDMELTLNRLPKGASSDTTLRVTIAVDENGKVVACNEWPVPDRRREKSFPELAEIGCRQMMNQYTAIPAKDLSGRPVRSVQNATIAFKRGRE